jgi:hypothetical protein
MKRTVVALLVVALTAGGVAIALGSSSRSQPHLRLVSGTPLKARGTGFHARERIRTTARTSGQVRLRRVTTDARGAFTVSFGALSLDPCAGFTIVAVGARGDSADLKLPMRECAPRL